MTLEVEHLAFSYRKKEVLRDISFSLTQGEILSILGPNGVGKSTLFRCVLGLQRGFRGQVCLDGTAVQTLKPRDLARHIAYIPQFSSPLFRYSVLETVLMGTTAQLGPLSPPGKEQELRARQALERLGILHFKDRVIGTLSGGERQLVLLARALAQDTKFLVMDEPTASLDYGNSIRVMEMVSSLAQDGYGVMLSTHDPNQALRYASKALVLHQGLVRSFGDPKEAVTSEILSAVYETPIAIESISAGNTAYQVCIPTGMR